MGLCERLTSFECISNALLRVRRRVALAVLLSLSGVALAEVSMPVSTLSIGMYRINAEVAHTDENRQIGLMFRESMPDNHGMIFVFTREARHCMWMRNTLLPLSVAFLDADGRVLNIEDMTPLTEDSHCASGPARFALEMNQGWFAQRGFDRGARVRGVEHLPAPR